MTLLERIHAAIEGAGIDRVFMVTAPDLPEAVTVTPYMSTPFEDIPMSRESFQVAVRAEDHAEARTTAWKAFQAVDESGLHPSFRQSPTFLGVEDGRALYVFNFDIPASWDDLITER